ncbi:MAG: ABC transporter ATP-binding protein [Pseudomonadota bacterium]
MIRLENVSKSFPLERGRRVVLDDLSMTIPRGRSLALLGRNGAGKSTLLSLIAGSTKPDRGRVARRCRVSFPLGFSGSFHKEMTGAQNIRFVARIYGADVGELTEYVREFSELGPYLDQPVKVYSSGMKARLAFGVSMGIRFDTYLVDELTAVGDQTFKKKSRAAFERRLAESDVIMVSHNMRQLREYCDCGIVLEHGRVAVFDALEDAIARHLENMERDAARPAAAGAA